METKQEVIAKIQKLLRLSKSSNQHEAELAAQRASELMKKYQVEASAVETQQIRSGGDAIAEEYYEVSGVKMKLHWLTTLAHAAALLYDGTVLVNRGLWGTSFSFVGFASEIPAMKALFEHLLESWKSIVEADLIAAKEEHVQWRGGSWAPRDTMKFKHGHGQGYAHALVQRCHNLAQQRKAQLQATDNSCTALVLVRDNALAQWREQKKIKAAKLKQTDGSTNGYCAGRAAGRRIALGGALTQ